MDVHGTIIQRGSMQRIFSKFVEVLVMDAASMHESEAAQVAEMTLRSSVRAAATAAAADRCWTGRCNCPACARSLSNNWATASLGRKR